MRISLDFYNHLRMQVRLSDIVRQRIVLTKKGNEYLGICPFHVEKTPSFTVNDVKRFYHCFGCNAHGDAIRFIAETTGITYKEAAIKIAEDNGIELPKMSPAQEKIYEEADQLYSILELATDFFVSQITPEVSQYLEKRGINAEITKEFSIGYAPGGNNLQKFFESKSISFKDLLKAGLVGLNQDGRIYEVFNKRIIFPIRNVYNKVVGFGGRVIGEGLPKYINSPETVVFKKSETMYGENVAIGASYKKNYSIVVEGYLDVIALHKVGYYQTVASLGTSVTEKHLQKLWRAGEEIIVCLDGDAAGIRASNRLIDVALAHVAHNKMISFIRLPEESDPDDVIKSEGVKLFDKLLEHRIGLSEMIWFNEYQGKKFLSAESKATLEKKLEEYCLRIEDKSLAVNIRRYFKDQVWTNLINRKSLFKKELVVSKNILDSKSYTEMEVLENALCSFMIRFPMIVQNKEARDFLATIDFKQTNFNEFRDWFFEHFNGQEQLTSQMIEESIKKTRFYDSFLVISDPKMIFLDLSFINRNIDNQGLIFDWLSKKYYLLLLKQEYTIMLGSDKEGAELKASLYLEEIQKISKELNKLNEFFVN